MHQLAFTETVSKEHAHLRRFLPDFVRLQKEILLTLKSVACYHWYQWDPVILSFLRFPAH